MRPRPNPSPPLTVPVAFSSLEARDEFKRLLEQAIGSTDAGGSGELLLIGDRVVVKNVAPGAEAPLRASLDHLIRLAETRARSSAELHDASRRELLDAVLGQQRARATALRFGTSTD